MTLLYIINYHFFARGDSHFFLLYHKAADSDITYKSQLIINECQSNFMSYSKVKFSIVRQLKSIKIFKDVADSEFHDPQIRSESLGKMCSAIITKRQHVLHGNLLQNHFEFFLNFIHTEISIIFFSKQTIQIISEELKKSYLENDLVF